jgi:transcriptional regulator of acetoin/glycerol metabolism
MLNPLQRMPSVKPPDYGDDAPIIVERLAQSRVRCEEAYRLDRGRRAGPDVLTPGELRTLSEPLELLTRVARPEMHALLARLAPANYVVVLSDANGVAIDFVASGSPDRKLWRMGVCPGATWGEPHVGTNGIGTCIMSRAPIIVHQRDHFLFRYADLTCTAAPLFDAKGGVLASLDASSVANLPHEIQTLVLQLVVQTARRIERLYFLERHREKRILTVDLGAGALQPKPVFMLAVGDDGCVIDMQGNTEDGSDIDTLAGFRHKNIGDILESVLRCPAEKVSLTHVEHKAVVNLDGQKPCFTVLRSPVQNHVNMPKATPLTAITRKAPIPTRFKPVLTLKRLAGRDPGLLAYLDKIERFGAHRLPFLIQGETGTGKEEFARAIHAHGPRASGPFVAIDCSSIPENLIESELFGYEAGTFTGARRDGRRGRIIEANGGTLFLDEIGDMPVQLQTRLLRVLAQNEVVPLGGQATVKVDFNLICATHQNLTALISQKRFRQDLYFRISGFRLDLPPLRARADKAELIAGALQIECDIAGFEIVPPIEPQTLSVLCAHSWPGNMRQLRLALRYALLSSAGQPIATEHLPDDILISGGEHEAPAGTSNELACEALEDVLRRNRWSITRAARELGVTRQTVHRWMNARNIKRPIA